MKIFIVHVYGYCCVNNSDCKIWVVAENADIAKIIVKQHTEHEIMFVEEFDVENEVIFSSARLMSNYKLKYQTDDFGNTKFGPYAEYLKSKGIIK